MIRVVKNWICCYCGCKTIHTLRKGWAWSLCSGCGPHMHGSRTVITYRRGTPPKVSAVCQNMDDKLDRIFDIALKEIDHKLDEQGFWTKVKP